MAIYLLAIIKTYKWQCWDLNYVQNHVDRLFKSQSVKHIFAIDEIPMSVTIKNYEIGTFLQLPSDFLNIADLFLHHNHLSSDEISCKFVLILGLVLFLYNVKISFMFLTHIVVIAKLLMSQMAKEFRVKFRVQIIKSVKFPCYEVL